MNIVPTTSKKAFCCFRSTNEQTTRENKVSTKARAIPPPPLHDANVCCALSEPLLRAQENCRMPALHSPSQPSNGVKSFVSPISPPLLPCPPPSSPRCTHRVPFRPISVQSPHFSSTHPFYLIRMGKIQHPYAVLLPQNRRETCAIPPFPLFSLFFYRVRKMEKNGQNPVWGRNGQKDEMGNLSLINGRFCRKSRKKLGTIFGQNPI